MSAMRNTFGTHAPPHIDRARGGILRLHLIIPAQQYTTNGACGQRAVTEDMHVKVDIDIEKLPLVFVEGYQIEETQDEPDEIPYPEEGEPALIVKHEFVTEPEEPNLPPPKPPLP